MSRTWRRPTSLDYLDKASKADAKARQWHALSIITCTLCGASAFGLGCTGLTWWGVAIAVAIGVVAGVTASLVEIEQDRRFRFGMEAGKARAMEDASARPPAVVYRDGVGRLMEEEVRHD